MEVRNTLNLIEDAVRLSQSLEEAKYRVAVEIVKGGCFIIAQAIIDQKIESLWQGKERARERALERLKERSRRGDFKGES